MHCFCIFRYQSSDFEEKLPTKQFPIQKNAKKQNQSLRSEPKKAKVDYEQKRKDRKNTDMASAFGFAEPEESELELVSKELNHLAAILHVYAGGLIFMK